MRAMAIAVLRQRLYVFMVPPTVIERALPGSRFQTPTSGVGACAAVRSPLDGTRNTVCLPDLYRDTAC
jgi:hypothetical protein